ncbi:MULTISPECIES: cytochrome P450 [Streptomyces]|uniref:Putative cytochrome P450 n=4 Tax=Streptomyces venezuelae TaxID=54571 RepID=F2R8C2_STRVP|nr:cytochrome P450 [Streptomyces venezuelae]APE20007.1 cytochrome [Streptomyces venezuelae]QER97409.1 cytochrome P450 [Streptomyces venezuelae ATCC 10712]CCA53840.1 putative cytochrome P450 [Streptomyces venezuelae ATCC 10712]
MTLPPAEHTAEKAGAVPPPGCPAHASKGPGGATRLYGPAAETDPMGLYEALRAEHGPVAPVLLDGDVRAWLVLGYLENRDVASRPTQYSRDPRVWHGWRSGEIDPATSPLVPMIGWRPDCVCADGEEHQRLRGAVTAGLSQFDHRGVRRHITRFAHQLIDTFCEDGEVELVGQFTEHLPMLTLTHLLGMSDESGPRLVHAARDLFKATETSLASNAYVIECLEQLVVAKRSRPGQDIASALMAHPAGLTDEEVLHHLRLILLAGYETTANLMSNVLRMVVTDPRFRGSLAGGQMTLPEAVEQVLWDEPPLMVCPGRWANGDTTLGGRQIKAGDMLLLGLAAGNVDKAIRPDASTPVHHNRAHLSFSAGTHECPGQDIGRIIADAGIDILLTRLPDIALAVPEESLSWRSSTWARHLTALPVHFAPRVPEGHDVPNPLPAPPAPSFGPPSAPLWPSPGPGPARPSDQAPPPGPVPGGGATGGASGPASEHGPGPRATWRTRVMRFLRRR